MGESLVMLLSLKKKKKLSCHTPFTRFTSALFLRRLNMNCLGAPGAPCNCPCTPQAPNFSIVLLCTFVGKAPSQATFSQPTLKKCSALVAAEVRIYAKGSVPAEIRRSERVEAMARRLVVIQTSFSCGKADNMHY